MEDKFKFEFNYLELNIIIKGLKELAYKESSGLIQSIIDSYNKQSLEIDKARRSEEVLQKNVEIAKKVTSDNPK